MLNLIMVGFVYCVLFAFLFFIGAITDTMVHNNIYTIIMMVYMVFACIGVISAIAAVKLLLFESDMDIGKNAVWSSIIFAAPLMGYLYSITDMNYAQYSLIGFIVLFISAVGVLFVSKIRIRV